MSYQDDLNDPRWQRKRLEIYNMDNWKCVLCGDSRSTLNVHHSEYRGKPWEVDSDKLQTLCVHCHSITHELKGFKIDRISKIMSINTKCWECVAYTDRMIVFLYLFPTSHKTEIITVLTTDCK